MKLFNIEELLILFDFDLTEEKHKTNYSHLT